MKVNKVAGSQVIEIPFEIENKESIVRTVETSISLLTYTKPQKRTLIVPGNAEDLPDVIPGGLVKKEQTLEGTLYETEGSEPGIQIESNIYYDTPTLTLFKSIYDTVTDLHNNKTKEVNLPKYQHGWFYVSPPSNEEASFHDHTKFNHTFPHDVPVYTWVTYLQLPNNCKGDEGMLAFKETRESVTELIDVKLDTLYLFPAHLLHQPNLAPYSTLNRITAAGNIVIPASEKSLFID